MLRTVELTAASVPEPTDEAMREPLGGGLLSQQRTKGAPHHTAVRAMASEWQPIIWRCWQNRQCYQEAVYEAALRRHQSPLAALFDRVELGKSPFKNPVK